MAPEPQPKVVGAHTRQWFCGKRYQQPAGRAKVEHQKFGFGEVIKMEGAAHNPIATVKFEAERRKENHAQLRQAADYWINQYKFIHCAGIIFEMKNFTRANSVRHQDFIVNFVHRQKQPRIAGHLNSTVMIKTGNTLVSIYTEMTPNPETMKFVANKLLSR